MGRTTNTTRNSNDNGKKGKKKKEAEPEKIDSFPKTVFLMEEEEPSFFKEEKTVKQSPSKKGLRDLLAKFGERSQEKEESSVEEEEAKGGEELLEDGISKVRKENVFGEALTEDEKEIISQRLEIQKKNFEELQKKRQKKIHRKIKKVHPYLTEEEIDAALEECEKDDVKINVFFFICRHFSNRGKNLQDQVILSFTNPFFLRAIREHIAKKWIQENPEEKKPVATRKKKKTKKEKEKDEVKKKKKK